MPPPALQVCAPIDFFFSCFLYRPALGFNGAPPEEEEEEEEFIRIQRIL